MAMIALLELVLDDHPATVFVFGNEVDTEGADSLLAFDTAELKGRWLRQGRRRFPPTMCPFSIVAGRRLGRCRRAKARNVKCGSPIV